MTSPSTLTLAKVKESSIRDIAGVCVGSTQFVRQLNEATDRLMNYGDWWATVVKARMCFLRNCVSFPRWVGTVLAINVGGQTRPIQGKWFDFMPLSSSDCLNRAGWRSNVTIVDDGLTPVFENIPCGQGLQLRTFPRVQPDNGKTVTYYGTFEGQEVMTRDALGNWSLGETVTLATPYVDTVAQFDEITRVTKELTQGPVDVYAIDAVNSVLLDVAHYDPSETDPMYRHATLRGGNGLGFNCGGPISGQCCPSGKARTLDFLAKLQFIPVILDSDTVQIESVPALKFMIQALRLEEAGDDDGAMKKQILAIKELNRQLRNKLPLDQIPIDVSSCGTALPSLHGIGQMM